MLANFEPAVVPDSFWRAEFSGQAEPLMAEVLPIVSTGLGIVLHTARHQIPSHRPPRRGI
jgi:hypothetical protein